MSANDDNFLTKKQKLIDSNMQVHLDLAENSSNLQIIIKIALEKAFHSVQDDGGLGLSSECTQRRTPLGTKFLIKGCYQAYFFFGIMRNFVSRE